MGSKAAGGNASGCSGPPGEHDGSMYPDPPWSLVGYARVLAASGSTAEVDFAPGTVQKLSPASPSNNHSRLSFYDLVWATHDWFSTLRGDCPMKLPGLLYSKPKTNHYGCPMRVIIRMNTGLWDYGVAK